MEAGLPDDPDRLLLAREPTAAALYCVAKGELLLTEAGTRFMVVDCGGGTVDITAYESLGGAAGPVALQAFRRLVKLGLKAKGK